MKPFIIDSDQSRAKILFDHLKITFSVITENDNYLERITDVNATIQLLKNKQTNLLFIHKSNTNADTLISQLPNNIWTVVYSGGGIGQDYSQTNIAAYKDVFDIHTFQNFLNIVDQVINALQSNQSKENQTTEFKKIFGVDPEEEALTEAIFTPIYENKGEDVIEKAISERDKYIKKR